jgi:tetratricopeptide (TPR) repeat protein
MEPAKLTKLMRGELDWIVMKALEKDRTRRYESASGMAHDIERYLHDEPVEACPPSRVYRVKKFVRRNKGPVVAAGLVLLTLIAGVVGTTYGLIRAEQQRLIVEGQRQELAERNQALEAAHEHERLLNERARQAIETVASETAIEHLTRQQEMRPEQKEFLDKVIQYYAESTQEAAATEQERARQARAYFRVGGMNHILGRSQDSETAYRRAVALFQQLAVDFPKQPEHWRQLGRSYANLSSLLEKTNRLTEAESANADALAIFKQLAAGYPNRPEFRGGLAGNFNNRGNLFIETGRPKEAEAAYAEALAIRKKLVSEFPTEPIFRRALAMSHNNLGWMLQSTGRLKEAESAYAEAVANYKQIIDDFPNRPDFRMNLAQSYNNLGNVLRDTEQPKEAEAAKTEALLIYRQLVAEFPNRPDFRQEMVEAGLQEGGRGGGAEGEEEPTGGGRWRH